MADLEAVTESGSPGGAAVLPEVVVVGGGIAGLAAAHALALDGRVRVTLLEGSPRLGGKVRTGEVAGVTVDEGAESLLARRPEALDLARAVGLGDDLLPPSTLGAAVWSRGALRSLPAGHVMGVPTSVRGLAASGIVGRGAVLRAALDLTRPGRGIGSVDGGDVSVASYLGDRLGRAVVDRLVEPLLGGVYAGRAERLSLAATLPAVYRVARDGGSLMRGLRRMADGGRGAGPAPSGPVFLAPRGGVGRLATAVAAALDAHPRARVRTGATVRAVRPTDGGWALEVGSTAAPERLCADAVLLAVPAPAAARLLACSSAGADLAGIDYASMAIVTLAFARAEIERLPPGSGFLVPAVEGRAIKAATFSSAKWGWLANAAPGVVVVRCSVGRYGDVAELQLDDAELTTRALAGLQRITGIRSRPIGSIVSRWGGGLPQYDVGHLERVARIKDAVARLPRLEVCGAAYDGVGIPACIASARAAVARLLGQFDAARE